MPQDIQEVAFVIRRFLPYRQKVALLTRSFGRINAVIKQQDMCVRLWPGMLITCDLHKEGCLWSAGKAMIYTDPHSLWIHHILELCYYFIPIENPCADVFFYLKQCNSIMCKSALFDLEAQEIIKKVCVMKFLSLMGFYAQSEICCYTALFQELSDDFVDFTSKQKVDSLQHRLLLLRAGDMDTWILNCLKSHPMFKMFKTIAFHYSY